MSADDSLASRRHSSLYYLPQHNLLAAADRVG